MGRHQSHLNGVDVVLIPHRTILFLLGRRKKQKCERAFGQICETSWKGLGKFWQSSRLGELWHTLEVVWGIRWQHLRRVLGSCEAHLEPMLNTSWSVSERTDAANNDDEDDDAQAQAQAQGQFSMN